MPGRNPYSAHRHVSISTRRFIGVNTALLFHSMLGGERVGDLMFDDIFFYSHPARIIYIETRLTERASKLF